tara:strand:+ start:5166 stop:5906 length:741 start_codon:yes stop_codon:yes gene_type:complete
MSRLPTVYIGYDAREDLYSRVLEYSIKKYSSSPINIVPIKQDTVRRMGMYHRTGVLEDGQEVDAFDRKPFSTEFSFTRFLVPFLNSLDGQALFMDCDMFVRSDIMEVFNNASKSCAVSCVKHTHVPNTGKKMDGKSQQSYFRKNWSSFVMWNCDHPQIKELTVSDVNTKSGSWLHSFYWCEDIGSINEEWNWLDGHSSERIEPKAVHFTTGGPLFRNWDGNRSIDNHYAKEWQELCQEMKQKERQE